MKRALLVVAALLGVIVAGAAIFVATYKPKQRPASTEKVDATPARVERGRYLYHAVMGCDDCHAARDLQRYAGPLTGGSGAGGPCVGTAEGIPGKVCPSNITPDQETGLGAWSDGEILRAVREGIDRQGRELFPMMPYGEYSALSDEDARSLVAYLRTLPPVKNAVPDPVIDFPISFFVKMAPRPLAGAVAEPDRSDPVAHGRYLAKVSGCQFCHTPVDGKKDPLPGQDFSGGQEFKGPWGSLYTSNLTPHETGLGQRDQQAFVGMFKAWSVPAAELPKVTPAQNTIMPWLSRAQMTEPDLGAIYAFLRTVPAIERVVEKRAPPPAPAAVPPAAAAPAAAPAATAQ
jgi:mono/diheme cytochrome c family protein